MGEDGQDDHAGHAVADGDEPEGRGADGLLGSESLGLGLGAAAPTAARLGGSWLTRPACSPMSSGRLRMR